MKHSIRNLFQEIPQNLPEELIETIHESPTVRIERIISDGHHSEEGYWYDQSENEWVVVLSGCGSLILKDPEEKVCLNPGDFIHIAAHRKHRVESTSQNERTVWLAIFY